MNRPGPLPPPSTTPTLSGFWLWGPAALVFAFALFAPWSIAYAQIAVVAGGLLLIAGVVTRRLRYPRLPWTHVAILIFLACQAISIPFGVHPARSLRCFRGSWVLLFAFFFWGLIQSARTRRIALPILIWSGASAGLYGIVQHAFGIDTIHHKVLENYGGGGYVAVGNLNSHLTYAGVLLPIFFLALALWLGRLRSWWWGLAAALIGFGLLFSFTRSAWIGAACGVLVLGLFRGRRAVLAAVGGLAGIAAVALLFEPALRHRLLSVLQIGDDPRARLWRTALRIAADHPWTGAGLGAYKTQFPLYKVPGEYLSTVHPHSDPLNVLVETGLLGSVAWVALWVLFFLGTRAPREPAEGRGILPGTALLDGIRAGVAALLVAGLGQCYSTDEEVAQVWWFLVTAALWEAASLRRTHGPNLLPRVGERRRSLWKDLKRAFKSGTLPLAARWLAPRGRPRDEQHGLDRILIVRQDNRLGNLLLLTPFLERLRQAAPGAHIAFLSGEAYAPLLHGWPWCDEWIVQQKRRHASQPWLFPAWIRGVRAAGWDLTFEVSNPNTHSYYNALLAVASGAPERTGFAHPRSADVLTRPVAPPERTHFSLAPLALLRAQGWDAPGAPMSCPLPGDPSPELRQWKQQAGVDRSALLLHLGGRDRKAWPLSAWATLLPHLREEWRGPIVLIAGPGEQDRLAALTRRADGRIVTAPALPLLDLAHLVRGAGAYVGCDSGVMHLAVACGTPTVALFFRSNPYHYAPLGEAHRTVLLANPYGVTAEEWHKPVEGMARSALLWAEPEPEASQAGRPETGIRAVEAVLAALRDRTGRTGPEAAARRHVEILDP